MDLTATRQATGSLRNGLALVGVLAVGYWLGSGRTVKAATTPSDIAFQMTGVSQTSALLVYQPSSKTVYVYNGATTGSSNLQCAYEFVLGAPGGAIERKNCPVPSLR